MPEHIYRFCKCARQVAHHLGDVSSKCKTESYFHVDITVGLELYKGLRCQGSLMTSYQSGQTHHYS